MENPIQFHRTVATAFLNPNRRPNLLISSLSWLGTFAVIGLAQFMIVRACGYDTKAVAVYSCYFVLHVVVPGLVALHAIRGRSLSLTTAVALGVPTGFAIELFSYLGLSAAGAKGCFPYLPLLWIPAGAALGRARRQWPVRCRLTGKHALLALTLAGLFLWTVLVASSQMFSESPLVDGLPQRPIFHDWVYLLSRAAAIKEQAWPLEDPSLAGVPLQYHYFMLVHAAAASATAKLELATVLLRLMIVTLGGVLVVQAYALGRYVSRRPWGGVLAAFLTVGAGELSFAPSYGDLMFLGLFVRWLYVSPTFLFGMMFFGALLLAVLRAGGPVRTGPLYYCWIALLAAAATGAKGTVMPVVLLGLVLWACWRWWRERRRPADLVLAGTVMTTAFVAVYMATMSAWGGGDAVLEPLRVYHATQFWKENFAQWERSLAGWLPGAFATWLAALACGMVAFVGTAGVRLLALAYIWRPDPRHQINIVGWLGAVLIAGVVLGAGLHLDSYGELYLILMTRLPMAVLAAAFLVSAGARLNAWRHLPPQSASGGAGERGAEAGKHRPKCPATVTSGYHLSASIRWQRAFAAFAVAGIAVALLVQTGVSVQRQRGGFAEWLRLSPSIKAADEMRALHEAMLWLRMHTEGNAVLVANAFTPANLRHGRGILVDHTTAGVYYYYSALSERRLWVEGPSYLLDRALARRRMESAAELFMHGTLPDEMVGAVPYYALLDRSVGDRFAVARPEWENVFSSARFEIFRLPQPDGGELAAASIQ